jgi:hypothetical protein
MRGGCSRGFVNCSRGWSGVGIAGLRAEWFARIIYGMEFFLAAIRTCDGWPDALCREGMSYPAVLSRGGRGLN